jgi:hypothetical protein
MAGIARSQRLIAFNPSVSGGNSATFTCPVGYVVLVKSLVCFNAAAAALQAQVIANYASGIAGYLFSLNVEPTSFGQQELFTVIHGGDSIYALATGGPMTIGVFGAVLAGPNQFPPVEHSALELATELPA